MNTFLKYGYKKISINLPKTAEILSTNEPKSHIDKDDFLLNLKNQLRKQPRIYDKIAIVIGDKTRPCDYPIYLPLLVKTLLTEGAKEEDVTFYIAYGTHPKQSKSESIKAYGEIYKEYNFIHHDCNHLEIFDDFGKTKRGTPIRIRKDILDSSLIITFGTISYHYFAGFGGGRKLLFPGLGEKNAIYHNHSLFLDFKKKTLNPDCQPGKLTGNPLAEDLKEIDDFSPQKLSLYGILNNSGEVSQIHFGDTYKDFVDISKLYNRYYKSKVKNKFDLVIASSGGYPKDINFIQAHKSIHHASAFVKDGQKLIILTECPDGIGNPSFLKLFTKDPIVLFQELAKKYEGNGGTALSMLEKTKRISIFAVTKLSEEECQLLGIKKITLEEIQSMIRNEDGEIAVIKNATMLTR